MIFFESLMVAFSTYSVIPMPQFQWNEKNMKYALCFFPAVGLAIGLVYYLWAILCQSLNLSPVLFAAAATAIPLLISGGIHMDGFMDTVDAISSHQARERKLEILKDPNCGAFAVIYCGIYLLGYFGLCFELYLRNSAEFITPAFTLSRALSGLLAIKMPNARKSGMLYAFTKESDGRKAGTALSLTAVIAAAAMLFINLRFFVPALIIGGVWCLIYRRLSLKQFGGATGDTAGFFLQVFELLFLLGILIGVLL